jgi:hypothetical protein
MMQDLHELLKNFDELVQLDYEDTQEGDDEPEEGEPYDIGYYRLWWKQPIEDEEE